MALSFVTYDPIGDFYACFGLVFKFSCKSFVHFQCVATFLRVVKEVT